MLAVTTFLLMGQPEASAASGSRGQGGGKRLSRIDCGIDGVCGAMFVIDAPCYWEELWQMYQVDGHYSYKCYVCF